MPSKKTTIGGQALIEGILMRGPEKTSIAVRKPSGDLELKMLETKTLAEKYKIFTLPFFRGIASLVDSMKLGISALTYSASFYEDEEEESEGILDKVFGDKADKVGEGLSLAFSFIIAMALFFALPTFLSSLFKDKISNGILLNLIEGLIRIIIFLAYLLLVSKLDDMKRVFEYHGAEHKSIYCYEKGLDLTVENVMKQSMLHPRCGTSFLFSVMIISIVFLSFFGWPNPLMRMLTRLLSLPIIMGISYEVNRLLGKSDSFVAKIFTYPGLMIQKWATVKEPDEGQVEVAIMALKAVIPEDPELDLWK